jgi:NADPH:quinone reductase-like Zn-dependent oxidoreductase
MRCVLGSPPLILGWDVAGEVEEVGFGVTRFAPGDRVFGMPHFPKRAGAYAQYVTAPSRQFAKVPAGLNLVEAAALPLAGLTAWQSLVDTARVTAGQRVLVIGAAGGVGHLAVQIAKARGATVIATARSAKEAVVRDLGADEVIDYPTTAFETVVDNIDVVIDTVVGDNSVRALRTMRPDGILVAVPRGVSPELAEAAAQAGRRVTGILVEPDGAGMTALADLVAAGQLRPVIQETFALAEAAQAHRVGELGHTTGKLVLTID